ncbi:uncharacterized protein LOC113464844 isoform X2 [Ceratina calcarata]|uniref:Uncharacterized protein LOC113464844 isoform X2 n=1 Tax=Ceratina calcarata TaxID=156304 RepID=A0AAJ7S7Z5_9HYME|nr:uncharacterized protein LOC113464844 isoform X2 [Ceratina calcarata]
MVRRFVIVIEGTAFLSRTLEAIRYGRSRATRGTVRTELPSVAQVIDVIFELEFTVRRLLYLLRRRTGKTSSTIDDASRRDSWFRLQIKST